MYPIELEELKSQFKDLLDKAYFWPNIYPLVSPVLFVKKKEGSLRICIDHNQL